MLFNDAAAVATHAKKDLQHLMDLFSQACKDFSLVITLKKTNVVGQNVDLSLAINSDNYELEVMHNFIYLGSIISKNLSLEAKINRHIGKAVLTLACLATYVWENDKLTAWAKMVVYNTCVIITLLYGSKTWTTYARQEKKLNRLLPMLP